MKKSLFYSIKVIKRNKVISLITIVQFCVSIVLLNFSLGSITGIVSDLKFAKGFNNKNLYVIQASQQLDDDQYIELDESETEEYVEKIIDEYCKDMGVEYPKGSLEYYSVFDTYDCIIRWYGQHKEEFGETGNVQKLFTTADEIREDYADENSKLFGTTRIQFVPTQFKDYTVYNFDIIDDEMAEKLEFNLYKGKKLSETHNTEDTIEAIVYGTDNVREKISLGDKVNINIFNFVKNEYEIKTVTVTGILDTPYYLLADYSTLKSDEIVSLNNLITRFDMKSAGSESGECMFLIKPWVGFDFDTYYTAYNPQYYLELGSSDLDINALKNEYVSNGYEFVSVKSAYDNTVNNTIQTSASYGIVFLMSIIISLVTFFGTEMLFVENNKDLFAILRLNGATLNNVLSINIMAILILMLLSNTLAITIISIYNKVKHIKYNGLFGIVLNRYNYLVSAFLALLIIVLIIPFIKKLLMRDHQ